MNIDQFKNTMLEIVQVLLQNPANNVEYWSAAILSVAACAWVFLKVGDKLDLPNVGLFTSVIYTCFGLLVLVAAMAAAKIYYPGLVSQYGQNMSFAGLTVALSVVVIVPALNAQIHGKYLGTLLSWSLGLAAALAVCSLVVSVSDAIAKGGQVFERGREHNAETQRMIK